MPDEYADAASTYDAIYKAMKDYRKEAARVHELIQRYKRTDGNTLLDVACGTGLHDVHLVKHYKLEGLDYSPAMLAKAHVLVPNAVFHQGDMRTFDLRRRFTATTNLFSAIGHMKTLDDMRAAIARMAAHTEIGGVVIVEPFIAPEHWDPGRITPNVVPDKKVARITTAGLRNGHLATLDMLYFTEWDEESGTAKFFRSHHEIAMYTVDEYMAAFRDAGLDVIYDEQGLMGRGLFIGIKNS